MENKFKIFTRAIIKNPEWKILLVEKNNTRKIAAWKALLPGGTVEFWEKVEDALIREVKEETNLDVKIKRIVDTQTMIIDWVHWLWIYFECEAKNFFAENLEPEKHTRVFWTDWEELESHGKEVFLKFKEKLWKI